MRTMRTRTSGVLLLQRLASTEENGSDPRVQIELPRSTPVPEVRFFFKFNFFHPMSHVRREMLLLYFIESKYKSSF